MNAYSKHWAGGLRNTGRHVTRLLRWKACVTGSQQYKTHVQEQAFNSLTCSFKY